MTVLPMNAGLKFAFFYADEFGQIFGGILILISIAFLPIKPDAALACILAGCIVPQVVIS